MIDNITVAFELKGVPYSEFELGHAFAFRSFDLEKIFQRRFFAEFGFGVDMTDNEILSAFQPYSNEKLKDSDELERDAEKLSDILFSLDSYLKKIYRHCERLKRYTNTAANLIAAGNVADVETIRSRYKRGLKFRNAYAVIFSEIKLLRDKTEKAFKRLDGEAQHLYRKIFADRLKFARQKTKMSQKAFAEKLGLSQNGYSPYENGQRNPSIPMLIRLSKILGRSADWLLGQTAW